MENQGQNIENQGLNINPNPVQIVEIRSTNSEKGEMYRVTLTQKKVNFTSFGRRLSSVVSATKPLKCWTTVDRAFIEEVLEANRLNGTDFGDVDDLVDSMEMDSDGNPEIAIPLPTDYKAQIIVLEFVEGQKVPDYLANNPALMQRDNIDTNGNYKVRSWIDSLGNPRTQEPKIAGEGGEILKYKKKPIYRETALWMDEDSIEAINGHTLQHDKMTEGAESQKVEGNVLADALKAKAEKKTSRVPAND